jgi:uncharacterized oxidoreductase
VLTKSVEELRSITNSIVIAVGTPPDSATVVTDLLVGSHLAGHDSHGIQHLPRYVKEVQAGHIVPDARPEVVSETASTALVRGNWAWGHVTANFVTHLGIKKARQNRIVLVSSVEVNHTGRIGDYVEQAAAQGIVTLLFNAGHAEKLATAAPYGGAKPVLSPNPIGMGFPTDGGPPVVLDFATTQVAGGKVALAQAKGEQVPLGWIIDKEGNPSTNPNDLYGGGALLPFGEHKGFGIMVAIEILSRILAGSDAYSNTVHGDLYTRHAGLSLIAIDSGVFSSSSEFAARTTELVQRIRGVPPAQGFEEVMAPGDFEQRSRTRRMKEGIQIPESTWGEVVETAGSLGVKV